LTASGVLTFAPGMTEQVFLVAVVDDGPGEGDETVVLDLYGVVNAVIGPNDPAVLTLTEMICTCPPDEYEQDDYPVQAVELVVGEIQSHDFCDDATDWVTFTAEAGDIYTITTVSGGQRADTFLALYDTDASTLLAANDDCPGANDYSSCIVWEAPSNGVYYLHTSNRANLDGCATDYDLSIERQDLFQLYLPMLVKDHHGVSQSRFGIVPTGIISHTCPDTFELDDTWEQAGSIESGVAQIHSFDSNPYVYAADKDFVWFDGLAGRPVSFSVVLLTNTQTLLELYDANGAALNVTGTLDLVWTPPSNGRYYLSASPLNPTYFGCADEAGYQLLMEMPGATIYLPVILKSFGG
jgi:hypothetical protein